MRRVEKSLTIAASIATIIVAIPIIQEHCMLGFLHRDESCKKKNENELSNLSYYEKRKTTCNYWIEGRINLEKRIFLFKDRDLSGSFDVLEGTYLYYYCREDKSETGLTPVFLRHTRTPLQEVNEYYVPKNFFE